MTVRELIELLSTLPPDAPVALLHYYDADDRRYDSVSADSISIETGKPMVPGSTALYEAAEGGEQVVVIR